MQTRAASDDSKSIPKGRNAKPEGRAEEAVSPAACFPVWRTCRQCRIADFSMSGLAAFPYSVSPPGVGKPGGASAALAIRPAAPAFATTTVGNTAERREQR